jgi:hypothetical protein
MENQHRKITGYRDLSEADISAMNLIKGHGASMTAILNSVRIRVASQRAVIPMPAGELARLDAAQPERWIAIANTHFQEGLMALTRAVAQPSSF